MTVFTTHVQRGRGPVLVREGFSVWAALFGWVWLLFQQAWIAAVLMFVAGVVVARACVWLHSPFPGLGLFLVQGLVGRDLVRWGLARRGYAEGPPVVADDRDTALARLLSERADVLQDLAGARV